MKTVQPLKTFRYKCRYYEYNITIRVYKTFADMYAAFREDWEFTEKTKGDTSNFEKDGTLGLTQVIDYDKPSCFIYLSSENLRLDIVAHEMLHAIIAASRYKDPKKVHRLGGDVTKKEECFCHAYDLALSKVLEKLTINNLMSNIKSITKSTLINL